MAVFSLVEARVASFYVETVILGIYLITFCEAIYSLFSKGLRKKSKEVNQVLATVALVVFFNTIITTALSFTIIWEGLVLAPPGIVVQSFTEPSYWPVVVRSILLLFQTLIANAILIYRCWLVHFRYSLVTALSAPLWLAGLACTIVIIFHSSQLHIHAQLSMDRIHPFGVAFWASSVVLNIITTAFLVRQLLQDSQEHLKRSNDSTMSRGHNTLGHAMGIITGSGILYTVVSFITFVTYTVGHNALHIATGGEIGVTGIVLNLIITRIVNGSHLGKSMSGKAEGGLPLQIMGPQKRASTTDNKGRVRYLVSDESARNDFGGLVEISGTDQSKTRLA